MPRIEDVRGPVDKVLTVIAQGYRNNEFVGSSVFKKTIVAKESGKFPVYGKSRFEDLSGKLDRPLRAKAKERDWRVPAYKNFNCTPHALAGTVEKREVSEAFPLYKLLLDHVEENMALILLEKEINMANLLQNTNSYAVGHTTDLTASPWDTSTDVASAIAGYRDTVRSKIGSLPNVMVIGYEVFRKVFQFNTTLMDKIKYTQKSQLTTDLIASLLELDNVVVGKSVYAIEGQGDFLDIWGDSVILAHITSQNGKTVPTFAREFQVSKHPYVAKWFEEPVLHKHHVEDNYDLQVTDSEAGYLLYNAVA